MMEQKVAKRLNSFLKSLNNPKIMNNYQKEREEIKKKSDNLRKLNVSSLVNSKFELSTKIGFKSSECRFYSPNKKIKRDYVEGKFPNFMNRSNITSDVMWETLVHSNRSEKENKVRRYVKFKSRLSSKEGSKNRHLCLKKILSKLDEKSEEEDNSARFHGGKKINYQHNMRGHASGSISKLLNMTPSEADMMLINPKKYYKRLLDMSSDIFSTETPNHVPRRRSVNREILKESNEFAGNYKDHVSHEFYDIIHSKNKHGHIFRRDYDYNDHRNLGKARSLMHIKKINYTEMFSEINRQSSEMNTINLKPQGSSTLTSVRENVKAKYKMHDDNKSNHVKSFNYNPSESTTIYSKGSVITKGNTTFEGVNNKKKF